MKLNIFSKEEFWIIAGVLLFLIGSVYIILEDKKSEIEKPKKIENTPDWFLRLIETPQQTYQRKKIEYLFNLQNIHK